MVYAGAPAAKTLSEGDTQVLIPLNCQNLAGSVEVVLQLNENKDLCRTRHAADGLHIETNLDHLPDTPVRQPEGSLSSTREVSILNDRRGVLTRTLAQISVH